MLTSARKFTLTIPLPLTKELKMKKGPVVNEARLVAFTLMSLSIASKSSETKVQEIQRNPNPKASLQTC